MKGFISSNKLLIMCYCCFLIFSLILIVTPETEITSTSSTQYLHGSTWEMKNNYDDVLWFIVGINEIQDSDNGNKPGIAYKFLEKVKYDSGLLTIAIRIILNDSVETKELVTADGWATPIAADKVAEMQIVLSRKNIYPKPHNPTIP